MQWAYVKFLILVFSGKPTLGFNTAPVTAKAQRSSSSTSSVSVENWLSTACQQEITDEL